MTDKPPRAIQPGRRKARMTLRLSDTAFAMLDRLAAEYNRDRTAILELAIRNLEADVQRKEAERNQPKE